MNTRSPLDDPGSRVKELVSLYSSSQASAAYLLCDRHSSTSLAYKLIASDLSVSELTYGELRSESERLAASFSALGIRSGDRVATLMGKSRAYLVTILAIWRLGGVHVPLFTAFAPSAIALRLYGSGARAVVCDQGQQSKLNPGEQIPPDATWKVITTAVGADVPSGAISLSELLETQSAAAPAAVVGGNAPIIQIYTSGTTGNPKGIAVPLRALASFQIYAEYALGLRDDDVFWNSADPGWGYGLYFGILATLLTGVKSVLLDGGFSADTTLKVLSRYGVTNFTAAPTVYRSIRASGLGRPLGLRLRCASSAGEPLTPEVNEWAATTLGVPVYDHYGQTEAGMLINNHHHPALRRPLKPGSMGHAMPGWTATILKHDRDEPAPAGEVGRLAMDLTRSPLAWFNGYTNGAGEKTDRFVGGGRWYITGDVGRVDDEGYFYFSSRNDDVIIMAGYRIGPFEVESVILTHPAVSECAVVAVPDDVRGEVLEAVIVLREGHDGSLKLTEELQRWVKTRYAAHAYPRRIHYVAYLPKTPSGKIQRFLVREQLRQRAEKKTSCA